MPGMERSLIGMHFIANLHLGRTRLAEENDASRVALNSYRALILCRSFVFLLFDLYKDDLVGSNPTAAFRHRSAKLWYVIANSSDLFSSRTNSRHRFNMSANRHADGNRTLQLYLIPNRYSRYLRYNIQRVRNVSLYILSSADWHCIFIFDIFSVDFYDFRVIFEYPSCLFKCI